MFRLASLLPFYKPSQRRNCMSLISPILMQFRQDSLLW